MQSKLIKKTIDNVRNEGKMQNIRQFHTRLNRNVRCYNTKREFPSPLWSAAMRTVRDIYVCTINILTFARWIASGIANNGKKCGGFFFPLRVVLLWLFYFFVLFCFDCMVSHCFIAFVIHIYYALRISIFCYISAIDSQRFNNSATLFIHFVFRTHLGRTKSVRSEKSLWSVHFAASNGKTVLCILKSQNSFHHHDFISQYSIEVGDEMTKPRKKWAVGYTLWFNYQFFRFYTVYCSRFHTVCKIVISDLKKSKSM